MTDISGIFADLDTKLRNFKRQWGIEFLARVKARTPVLTGKLQNSWGFLEEQSDIEIYNVADYASFVEFGTPKMAPRAMLQTTILESDQITDVVTNKLGLNK